MLAPATAGKSRVDELSKMTLLTRFAHKQKAHGDEKGAEASLNLAQALRSARRP